MAEAVRSSATRTGERAAVTFEVPYPPVPMARPRVALRNGTPHAYTPARTALAEWHIRQAAIEALGDQPPFEGPLMVILTVWIRMPSSIPKRDREDARPARRPDLDRYVNTALDGLSPLWRDDAQVTAIVARKVYGHPHWRISVGPDHSPLG